jgi:biopolymer transport protein ExbD
MNRKIKRKQGNAEVNMTPMLDIVFILLIFFIVTSSFNREKGLDVTKKNNQPPDEIEQLVKPVVIQVCANKEILLDKRVIDMRAVRANVERKKAELSNIAVVVEAEPEAPTGLLVKVMDQVIAARASISIAPAQSRCQEQDGLQVTI